MALWVAAGVFMGAAVRRRQAMKQATAHTTQSIAIKGWITRHPALAFYVLTLTFSWGYWFSLLAQRLHVTPGSSVTHFPGLLGPMLAAIVVTTVLGGRMAMRELFGRMFRLGSHGALKLALALSPLALGAAACIVMLALGQPIPAAAASRAIPACPRHGRWPLWLLPSFWSTASAKKRVAAGFSPGVCCPGTGT